MLVDNFVHYPGVHCESSAIRDILAFHGLRLSEPTVFGLGSGLGFIYWDMKRMPFPFVGGRVKPDELAKNLSENIGFDLTVEETRSAERAWMRLREDLSKNQPVGLKLDMFYLGYRKQPPHFAAHYVVACGFDGKGVFVADTAFRGVQKVSMGDLKRACSAKGPFSSSNLSFRINNVPEKIDFEKCIRHAIRKTAGQMLKPPIRNMGISGIRRFSREVLGWHTRSKNPQRDFGLHYAMFENAGTGGAGFRNLYRDFLKESIYHVRDKNLETAYKTYSEVAPEWTKISERIRDAPKSKNIGDELAEISKMISLQADKEEKAMRILLKI